MSGDFRVTLHSHKHRTREIKKGVASIQMAAGEQLSIIAVEKSTFGRDGTQQAVPHAERATGNANGRGRPWYTGTVMHRRDVECSRRRESSSATH